MPPLFPIKPKTRIKIKGNTKLKTTAEGSERLLFHFIQEHFIWLLLIAPLAGLFFIALIKKAFNTPISGLREILNSLREPTQTLSPIKAIVHFLTGFITIVFGGSTGIEVSTVVASAAGGSLAGRYKGFSLEFKRLLIVAGAAAGIAAGAAAAQPPVG